MKRLTDEEILATSLYADYATWRLAYLAGWRACERRRAVLDAVTFDDEKPIHVSARDPAYDVNMAVRSLCCNASASIQGSGTFPIEARGCCPQCGKTIQARFALDGNSAIRVLLV